MSDLVLDRADDGDEVGRQRRKRTAVFLDRPVAGFDDVTLDDVIRSVLAATDESKGRLDVDEFLTRQGHLPQTVEMVQVCLTGADLNLAFPPRSPSW